ncbi:hypothetical protein GIB67_038996 [Kingdonia uniflora]|uniref:eIF-4F 25 kDa subunit n=1 Tax=Kingdonia uniflora TaxID=39325 RepID=A0A7J7P6Y1_9MAGN|nr:hypothetical protein GIB67_038996 [Kingdonia uniflora]
MATEVAMGVADEEKGIYSSLHGCEDEPEEGEIIGDVSESLKSLSIANTQPHLLEHAWTFWFDKSSAKSRQLLAMIGEQFDHGDEICGAVVNLRVKQEKISIWTKNAVNEAAQVSTEAQD